MSTLGETPCQPQDTDEQDPFSVIKELTECRIKYSSLACKLQNR